MTDFRIAVLPGDGIGPEVTREAERVLSAATARSGTSLWFTHHLIGASAYHATGQVFPAETRAAVATADAVLLGAVGDPSLDRAPRDQRPEAALLGLRSLLGAYANLRPVRARPALAGRSPIRPELLQGVDRVEECRAVELVEEEGQFSLDLLRVVDRPCQLGEAHLEAGRVQAGLDEDCDLLTGGGSLGVAEGE